MKKIRYVRKDFFLSPFSSWHCAETTKFFSFLGNYRSGIGRKSLKGALIKKTNAVAIEAKKTLHIVYIFPAETDANALISACKDWNQKNTGTSTFLTASCDAEGGVKSRSINLVLHEWALEPEVKKEVADA